MPVLDSSAQISDAFARRIAGHLLSIEHLDQCPPPLIQPAVQMSCSSSSSMSSSGSVSSNLGSSSDYIHSAMSLIAGADPMSEDWDESLKTPQFGLDNDDDDIDDADMDVDEEDDDVDDDMDVDHDDDKGSGADVLSGEPVSPINM